MPIGELNPLDQPAGNKYAVEIIQLWLECIQFSQQVRMCWLKNEFDNDLNTEYVARLTRLWAELAPKIEGMQSEFGEFVTEYKSLGEYYRNPSLLLDKPEDIMRLEIAIRQALEKLKLTSWKQ